MTQFERSAKKRRLMTTPEWTGGFKTNAIINSPQEGSRPFFVKAVNYDARGMEKAEPKKEGEAKAEPSFFSKY